MENIQFKNSQELTFENVWFLFRESDRKFQETREELRLKSLETDKKFQQTRDMLNELRGHFDKQLGKLVEALINKNTIRLFKQQGIKVHRSIPNPTLDFDNTTIEFDSFLLNDTDMVVIEAKVSLTKQKVLQFAKKIEHFKTYYKEYKNFKVFPCLAYITAKDDAKAKAEDKGFYLLEMKDKDHFEFGNHPNFIPKAL